MSSYVRDGDDSALVEREGVNAGGPVDRGASPAAPSRPADASGADGGPERAGQGQGQGELLSGAGSRNGVTHDGPGQELSAEEG